MLVGVRGSGLHTQLARLHATYRLPTLEFKSALLALLRAAKERRRTERAFLRGFKAPEFDEEGNRVEDAEIENEGEDYDRTSIEIAAARDVFQGV
jgi:hypothetical protein